MYKEWGKIPYHSDYGNEAFATRYVYENDLMALDVQEPIEKNKIVLASWRLCGSEFVKEVIRENFPEYCKYDIWCKAHGILTEDITEKFIENDVKVVVVIMDPRNAASNILNYNNGQFFNKIEYELENYEQLHSREFLDAVADKQIQLINFYRSNFGPNCTIIRYEDACFNQNNLLSELSNFFKLSSLGIDDTKKYKSCIYKHIGDFGLFFEEEELDEHFYSNEDFYTTYGYHKMDYKHQINYALIHTQPESYLDFLQRNRINLDETIAQRIISHDVKSF